MFYSVLFPTEESAALPRRTEMPDCFGDLQLDLIMKQALQDRQNMGLEEIFFTPVTDPSVLRYRQEVMEELEDPAVRSAVLKIVEGFGGLKTFMEELQGGLARQDDPPDRSYGPRFKFSLNDLFRLGKNADNWMGMGRMLSSAFEFTCAVAAFARHVRSMTLRSQGLRGFADYVASYCESEHFQEIETEAKRLREFFDQLRYCLWIKKDGSEVKVLPYEEREDYVTLIEGLFGRFRQADAMDFRRRLSKAPFSKSVENEILQRLSRQYPEEFQALRSFCTEKMVFDDVVVRFALEVRFYFCWLELTAPLKEAGLPFCCPVFRERKEEMRVDEGFDLALAIRKPGSIVTNGFYLTPPEQILVITGPNQGGKTTFARAFGQIHYLASLGLPVPGRRAELFLCDGVLTHFEREETPVDLNGKLRDDLRRLKKLLDAATPRTVTVINEIFSSTTAWDALGLGKHMLDALAEKGAPAVVVTFLEELADYGPQTVSMRAEALEEGKARSFRILRKEPGGLSYAMLLAERHGLGYEEIKRRVGA